MPSTSCYYNAHFKAAILFILYLKTCIQRKYPQLRMQIARSSIFIFLLWLFLRFQMESVRRWAKNFTTTLSLHGDNLREKVNIWLAPWPSSPKKCGHTKNGVKFRVKKWVKMSLTLKANGMTSKWTLCIRIMNAKCRPCFTISSNFFILNFSFVDKFIDKLLVLRLGFVTQIPTNYLRKWNLIKIIWTFWPNKYKMKRNRTNSSFQQTNNRKMGVVGWQSDQLVTQTKLNSC